RSAVYHSATLVGRQAAHRALAAVLTDERHADHRTWHLAAAAMELDDDVADELERLAHRATLRGGYATSAAALARAAALTVDAERRGRRQLSAADAAFKAGHAQVAKALLDEARGNVTAPPVVAEI